jgi:iron complex transport system ATP-binding protein
VLRSAHPAGTALLQLDGVVAGYVANGHRTAVSTRIDETLRAGELSCLIGPNGAGKSTLMRTMAGLQAPLDGVVRFDGADVHRMAPVMRARKLAVVLTEAVQVAALTAYDLVAFGRVPYTDWGGRLTTHDRDVIRQALDAVGATDLSSRFVMELSDGERQRVMIARALAQEPSAMILDEITGFLDLPRRIEIMQLLRHAAHEWGCAVLLSTHDLDLALRTADRIWLMPKDRPLHTAMPETLVLNGAFQAAFSLADVAFDEQSGSFRVRHPRHWPVTMTGDTSVVMWTERALERYGFYVTPTGGTSSVRIEVIRDAAGARWHVHFDDASQQHTNLEELIHALRKRHQHQVDTDPF